MASVDQGAHYSRELMLDALGDLLGADWSEVRELEAMEQGRLNAILVTVTKIINEGKRVKS